jgi:flagellar biogenesis protein FliO
MADETTTGASKEVTVDLTKAADKNEAMKKLIIKVIVAAVLIVAAVWLYKRFVK